MFEFKLKRRVRYGETDKMGFLYYGKYAEYYEVARVEALRSLGVRYRDLEDHSQVLLPVVSMEVKYLKPAYYDEELLIITRINDFPEKMISFDYEIFNENSELINKALVRLFFVDSNSMKRKDCPKNLLNALRPYFEK